MNRFFFDPLIIILLVLHLGGCVINTSGNLIQGDADPQPEVIDLQEFEFHPDVDGFDPVPDVDVEDIEEEVECREDVDCSDNNPCNGEETCSPTSFECEEGTPPEEGFVCNDDPRSICLAESCVASTCGDGFVDSGGGESCEPPGEGNCGDDCRYLCEGDDDCPDDSNVCNGEEYCDTGAGACDSRNPPDEGTECGTSPRKICISLSCQESICGDGFTDSVAGEECDDGNGVSGDGCDNDCAFSCHNNSECSDGHDCTDDICNVVTHVCTNAISPDTTTCRLAAGICDIEETCDGIGQDCPANEFLPSTMLCRSSAGICDVEEYCTGTGPSCPANTFAPSTTICRTSAGICDLQENCTGSSPNCPADTFRRSSYVCRFASGVCDVPERCTGSGPLCPVNLFAPSTTLCRASAHQCDAEEYCTGMSDACPIDLLEPDGTPCNDGDPCTFPDECNVFGSCSGPPSDLHDVTAIASGKEHVCVLMDTGGVKCWGRNDKGQLGIDTATGESAVPVDVTGLSSGVVSIASGDKHSCVVTAAGGVKCWGLNDKGQLGNGLTTDSWNPVDVTGLSSGVAAVAGGGHHTCALMDTGGLKCWGLNDKGQLGDGTATDGLTPVDVSGLSSGVSDVACGEKFTCALLSTGAVRCWGLNDKGQIGDGSTTDRSTPTPVSGLSSGASAVSCGKQHACALMSAGGVKCWGLNDRGQLGDGTLTDKLTPVDVSGLSGASDISCGTKHTCAHMSGGAVKCWGDNGRGQLGDGTTTDSSTPVDVTGLRSRVSQVSSGGEFTCALLTTSGVQCWGKNDRSQLGNGSNTDSSVPEDVVCP